MSAAFEHASSQVRPHTKRGRHSTAPSTQPLPPQPQPSSDDDECDGYHSSAARVFSRQSRPTAAATQLLAPPLPAMPDLYSSSAPSHSPLDATLYSPTTSPLSPSRDFSGSSGATSASYSSSPLSSSQLAWAASPAPYGELQQSPVQSLKRLCVNHMDSSADSAEDDTAQRPTRSSVHSHSTQPHSHAAQQQQPQVVLLPAPSFLSQSAAGSRVMVKARRGVSSSTSASVTPQSYCQQAQPTPRPSTASSMLRASFNLSEPTIDYCSSLPANSAPTSTHASPHISATTSPQTRYSSILSSSVPSNNHSFLSLLNVSCATANSSFTSPAHSPSGDGSHSLMSQQATPSSAHSSVSFRPHIMSAQERAALFPSRSVTSSPIPPPDSRFSSSSSNSSKRTSSGKRAGMDTPANQAPVSIDVGRRTSDGGRHNKRMKEDRRRDRRRSIVSSYSEHRDESLGDLSDECDDMLLQLTLVPATTPAHSASRLSLYIGSSNSLSSLDSPSSTSSYPRMSAPLNSPVSGSQGRRAGHIAADHLLGTAAAAAGVARRRNSIGSLYEEYEDEQRLADAVGAMQLCNDNSATKDEEQKEAPATPPRLPTAPRLASRSTSLRLNLNAAISQPSLFPAESDSEQACGDADDDSAVLSSSPMPSRQQSSPAEFYESVIPSTGSFSQVLRAQRQNQLFASSSSSGSSSSSSPFPPSPVLSPLSPARPMRDSFMSSAAAAAVASVVIAPLSPVAFASHSSSSYPSLSSSLSGALSSSFATGPPLSLSPFASLPDFPPAFSRSASHTIDPRRLPFGNGQHTSGGTQKRHSRGQGPGLGAGLTERERAGDGVGLDVPFLKELSLPPRGPGRRSAMN